MLRSEVGPYKKPYRLLLAVPVRRITPKSDFLRKIERRQKYLARKASS
jgi:hypothetical protein